MRGAAHGAGVPGEHHLPQQARGGLQQADGRRARARQRDVRGGPRGGDRVGRLPRRHPLQVPDGACLGNLATVSITSQLPR